MLQHRPKIYTSTSQLNMRSQKPSTVFRQLLPYSDREEHDAKIRLLRYKYLSFTSQHVEVVALLNSVRIMGSAVLLPALTELIDVRDTQCQQYMG